MGLLILFLFTSLSPASAQAQAGFRDKATGAAGYEPEVTCLTGYLPPKLDMGGCVLLFGGWVSNIILWAVARVLFVVSIFFDMVLSVQNTAFQDQPLVNTGWIIVRDLVNIFYVFILLIIAIGTILQIEAYNAKQLVAKLVISALLVNFSLPLAGIVIDISNVLGNTFYVHMGQRQNNDCAGMNRGSSTCRDIASVLVGGLNLQKVYESNPGFQSKGGFSTLFSLLFSTILGSTLILVTAGTLFAGMFLLIARIITLWILLVFSPLAVFCIILPETRGFWQTWSKRLVSASLVYPIFMFMMYLVVMAVDRGVIIQMFALDSASTKSMFTDTPWQQGAFSAIASQANFVLGFIFLIGLMWSVIKVSGTGSLYGGDTALKWAGASRKWITGQAGRLANKYAGAPLSQRALETTGRIPNQMLARTLSRPFAESVRKAEADRTKQFDKQVKLIKDLAPQQAALMLRTLAPDGKVQAWRALDDKKKKDIMKELPPDVAVDLAQTLRRGAPDKKYHEEVSKLTRDLGASMQILGKDARSEKDVHNFLSDLDPDTIKNFMPASTIRENAIVQKFIADNFTLKDLRAFEQESQLIALGELLEKPEYVASALNYRINSSPVGGILREKLKKGERLSSGDVEEMRRRRGDAGGGTRGGVTGAGGAPSSTRAQQEQAQKENERNQDRTGRGPGYNAWGQN